MPGTKASGGRNAKSRGMLLVEGTFRKDRHADRATPSAPTGTPPRPRTLTSAGRAEWTRMVARLDLAGTLSTLDDAPLYQYCCLFAETEGIRADRVALKTLSAKLMIAIQRLKGEALVEAASEVVKLQFVLAKQTAQLRQGHMALRQYLVEFGMTPAARSRVTPTDESTPVNPLDRFTKARA
jgi:phage terminase small subunit